MLRCIPVLSFLLVRWLDAFGELTEEPSRLQDETDSGPEKGTPRVLPEHSWLIHLETSIAAYIAVQSWLIKIINDDTMIELIHASLGDDSIFLKMSSAKPNLGHFSRFYRLL